MNLYNVTLKFGYEHQKSFTFYVVAINIDAAEKLAMSTFKKYDYGDFHLHAIEVIATEGQYARPNILIVGAMEQSG